MVRNSGQFSVPNDLVFFSGLALKIRDCPEKFGTDGHLTTITSPKSVNVLLNNITFFIIFAVFDVSVNTSRR